MKSSSIYSTVIWLTLVCTSIQVNDEVPPKALNYRLPRNIRPVRYNIALRPDLSPDLNPATFNGNVSIELAPLENTKNITVQIRQLTIDEGSIKVTNSIGSDVAIESINFDTDVEFLVVSMQEELFLGETYTLTIADYVGTLHLDNGGFYLAKYEDDDGNERRFATTQFQSTNARRAFPSFDEPEWKATYNIKLIRHGNFSSISNEVLIKTNDLGNGFFEDVYAETVKMSSYLVAFVVSQYDYVEELNQRVFARPAAIRNGWADHALSTGIKTIQAIEDFVNVNYTLDKMDQIAIPDRYFAPGAMENWGLVTYRESYLLYSESYSTTTQLQKISTVIAHEFGHQWFGNLVTLSWWNYLWLNEGFATYFEYYAASVVHPSWRLMDQFVFGLQYAMEFDSKNTTEPMNYETAYPGGGAPSYVSYQKGGSVIRMMENFVTTGVFRQGLNVYLQARKFDIAKPDDLFEAMQEIIIKENKEHLLGFETVSSILTPWITQKGYPVVHIVRNYGSDALTLKQNRFFIRNYTETDEHVWRIPINFVSSANMDFSQTIPDFWLNTDSDTFEFPVPVDGFVLANKQQTGFYRVNYDDTNWFNIISYLANNDFEQIHVLNRAQLIDDAFNLARAGVVLYDVPLSLSKYLARETDYIPIYSFLYSLKFVNVMISTTDEYDIFKEYVINLLKYTAEQLSFEPNQTDNHVDKLNRVQVMTWLCNMGESECRNNSLYKLRSWINNNEVMTPDLQLYALCGALRIGNQDDWDFLYEKYENETIDVARSRILTALGCSEDEDILNRFLDKIVQTENSVLKTERENAFATVYNSGKVGLIVALDYVTNNFDEMKNSGININNIISGIGGQLSSQEQLEKLKNLDEVHGGDYFESSIKAVEENLAWKVIFMPYITDWLIENFDI